MFLHSTWRAVTTLVAALGVVTCASAQNVPLPPGTLMLGEVRHVVTRDLVNAGEVAPGQKAANLSQRLQAAGFTDAQIDAGRVVVVRYQIYWNNTSSGNKYSQQGPELVDDGLKVEPGNVVELEVVERGPGVIRRVRAPSLAEGACYYGDVPVGTAVELLGALSLVGPRGSASLYCAGIEKEGWQRPRTFWHKLPGAAAGPNEAPGAAPPVPVEPPSATPTAPGQAASTLGMARLTVSMSRIESPGAHNDRLPILVDGEKVAMLARGQCDVFLVPPGNHVVVAGEGREPFTWYARRELAVSVAAGDHVVLEYLTDEAAYRQLTAFLSVDRAKWQALAFRFVQRPATAKDACALRGPARVLGAKPAPELPK